MLPRLVLVVGLTFGVMLPLIWAAFAPVADFRAASEPDADSVHSGSPAADWRGAPPETAEPSNPAARSKETTIGTAPHHEGEASAARSDDLPRVGLSEPTLIKPKLWEAYDKEAALEPLVSEERKALPEEAKALPEKAKALPEEAKAPPEEARALPEEAKAPPKEAKALPKEAKAPPEEAKAPPVSEEVASAIRSDDVPRASLSEPTLIKPSFPQVYDKEAAPEPLLSEEAKPLVKEAKPVFEEAKAPPEEAKALPEGATALQKEAKAPPQDATTPTRNIENLPKVKERYSAPDASPNSGSRARANGTERQKIYRKKQRNHSGWVGIMREAGWLAPGRRR